MPRVRKGPGGSRGSARGQPKPSGRGSGAAKSNIGSRGTGGSYYKGGKH